MKFTFPQNARGAAELYFAKGLAPIPLPHPGYPNWQDVRVTPDALDRGLPVTCPPMTQAVAAGPLPAQPLEEAGVKCRKCRMPW
jgi:hypothetical protein